MRPSWDETWTAVASAIAARSLCEKRQVGAVVVSGDNRDQWVGYNGAPGGLRDDLGSPESSRCSNYCPQGSCEPERVPVGTLCSPDEEWVYGPDPSAGQPCVAIHAEVNALMQSDRLLRTGGTIYVTAAPCLKCALAIANSGVRRLVCPDWEPERRGTATLVWDVFQRTPGMTIDLGPWRAL